MANYTTLFWTEHVKLKMRQYGLSKTKLVNLIQRPERSEQGIAQGTTAVMKTNQSYATFSTVKKKTKKATGEIWLMYADVKGSHVRKIISAWRYPGVSKPGENIPIPEDILREISGDNVK